jgi:hypothetical protein
MEESVETSFLKEITTYTEMAVTARNKKVGLQLLGLCSSYISAYKEHGAKECENLLLMFRLEIGLILRANL